MRGIHQSPVDSSHKGQWHGALMFSLICARCFWKVVARSPNATHKFHRRPRALRQLSSGRPVKLLKLCRYGRYINVLINVLPKTFWQIDHPRLWQVNQPPTLGGLLGNPGFRFCRSTVGLNKHLSKQSRHRWFETPSCSLWCHCNISTENWAGFVCLHLITVSTD